MRYNEESDTFYGKSPVELEEWCTGRLTAIGACYIFITCVDSMTVESSTLSKLSKWITYLEENIDHKIYPHGVLIKPDSIRQIFWEHKTFFGYDELYVLSSMPDIGFKSGGRITSDCADFSIGLPDYLIRNFEANPSLLFACGDGDSLNVAFRSRAKNYG